ncbi:MAG TPA: type II toxin-antitoxin system VapC family toxin [Devosia sp.]|uniref:type II toxin-antitoxin system VapC family toxin n=1 Tax=Devosia sp. TaxID=1871048 RepID=UPI002F95809E
MIDTSVALQWVLPEDDAEASERLLTRTDMIAPDILLVEAANVLARKLRRDQIDTQVAYEGLDFIAKVVPQLLPSRDLTVRALDLSVELSHPVYDCIFLACAERHKAPLVTRDEPLIKRSIEAGYGDFIKSVSYIGEA